jgi:alkaline phosphatase D
MILAGASMAALSILGREVYGLPLRRQSFVNNPFSLGVASGDPDSNSVVLWTRLAPSPMDGGGMTPEAVEVQWEIAADEGFRTILQSGKALATPQLGHSVHVEVNGLNPETWYWYRFHCGDATSRTGRTRTMPISTALPSQLRFAFASCQHYETGLYTAYEHMAKEPLDLVLHLGDYIYEYAGIDERVRKHAGKEIVSLEPCIHYVPGLSSGMIMNSTTIVRVMFPKKRMSLGMIIFCGEPTRIRPTMRACRFAGQRFPRGRT